MPPSQARLNSLTVFALIAVLAVASAIALGSIVEQPALTFEASQPSPLGYTKSLVLFALPCLVLGGWLLRHPALKAQRKACVISLSIVLPVWCLLDILLGKTFFDFPNRGATLEIYFWGFQFDEGWHRVIPIEEFAFYITGISTILLAYMWAGESWLSAYRVDDEERRKLRHAQLLQFHLSSVLTGAGLFALALLYKKLGNHPYQAGFPGYFLFQLAVCIVPSAAFFRVVRPFVNWQAFSFTLMTLVLISLIWEATLAIPYGWWAYVPSQMLGLFIKPWSGLPVEAVVLWIAAAWMNVIAYELIRLLLATDRPLRHAFAGART